MNATFVLIYQNHKCLVNPKAFSPYGVAVVLWLQAAWLMMCVLNNLDVSVCQIIQISWQREI